MKVDLSSEFRHFGEIEFDSEQERRECAIQILDMACQNVVATTLTWFLRESKYGTVLDSISKDRLEDALNSRLLMRLAEREKWKADNRMLRDFLLAAADEAR